jgi:peptidoglycan/LPS O-acetylase OafA/YrhL
MIPSSASTHTSDFAQTGRIIPQLDHLRAVAVLLVILFHYDVVGCGWIGVQAFFVLSGFLITGILYRSKLARKEEGSKGFRRYLFNFYGRRILRIMPLYWGFVLLVGVAMFLGCKEIGGSEWLSLFTFSYNFSPIFIVKTSSPYYSHLWSLCVEEQFYLIWPFLVYGFGLIGLRRLCLLLVVLGPGIRFVLGALASLVRPDGEIGFVVYWSTLSHVDAFALGAYLALTDMKLSRQQCSRGVWLSLGTAVMLGLINDSIYRSEGLILPNTTLGYSPSSFRHWEHVWSYTVINVASASVLLMLTSSRSEPSEYQPGFLSRVLRRIGMISYGVYVVHNPVIGLGKEAAANLGYLSTLHIPLGIIAIILIAEISYRFYETPFLRLKDRFFRQVH